MICNNVGMAKLTLKLCATHDVRQAVLVDMEEGVVSELLSGPLGEVFDNQMLLTDVSGSGNNWYFVYIRILYIYSGTSEAKLVCLKALGSAKSLFWCLWLFEHSCG